MPDDKINQENVDITHMWFMLLGSVTSTLAVLSVLPSYALAFILTRSKHTNAVLFTLRSCVCADILSGSLFLVFVFPSWIRGDRIFGHIACTIGGVLVTWMGLVLPYSLVFVTFQRFSLSKRVCGWSLLRDRYRVLNVTIWISAGLVTALPFAESSTAYTYSTQVCYCALNGKQNSLVYDNLGYLLPGLLLFLAGICLTSIKSRKKDNRREKSWEYCTSDYHSKQQCYRPILSSKDKAFETRRVEAETRISFTYIAFVSSLLTLSSYGLRTYGNWKDSSKCTVQAASFLLTFADGISRSMTIFVVRRAMQKTYKERELKRAQKLASASNSKTSMRSSDGFVSEDILSRYRSFTHSRRSSAFTSFSLSTIPARSTHRKIDSMYSFWSDASITPKSSICSCNGSMRWRPYAPEMTWQDQVTRSIRDYKRQNYTNKTVKMQQSLRKRQTKIMITRQSELSSRGKSDLCSRGLRHTDYSSGETFPQRQFRPNYSSDEGLRCENCHLLLKTFANETQRSYRTRSKETRRDSRLFYNYYKEQRNIRKENYSHEHARYRSPRSSRSTGRPSHQLTAHSQVSRPVGNMASSRRKRYGFKEYFPNHNQISAPREFLPDQNQVSGSSGYFSGLKTPTGSREYFQDQKRLPRPTEWNTFQIANS